MGHGRQTVGQHWLVRPQGAGVGSVLTGRAGVVHLSQLSQTAVSLSYSCLNISPFLLCVCYHPAAALTCSTAVLLAQWLVYERCSCPA